MNAGPPYSTSSDSEAEQLRRIEASLAGLHWKMDTLVRAWTRLHLSTSGTTQGPTQAPPLPPLPRARPHRSGTPQLPPILRNKLLHSILGWIGERLVGYLLPFLISLALGAWTYGRSLLHRAIDFLTWLAG